jgi:alpha-tubulin suppressor-like RCC1 family protein
MGPSRAIAFLFSFASGCVLITSSEERHKHADVIDTGDRGSEAWKQLAAGGLHTCGLRDNGIVECWGKNDKNQSTPPADARFEQITAGDSHSCGLQADPNAGLPLCWGDNFNGAVGDAPPVAFKKLVAGGFHNCGLQLDGTALCWGQNDDGQCNVVAGEVYLDIAAGRHHTCAVRANGTIFCWGRNACDQTNYPGGSNWVRVYCGDQYSCALDDAGEIECWGAAKTEGCDYDEGTKEVPETDPKDLDEPWVWEDMSAGPWHACGLTTRKEVLCWGQAGQDATNVDDDYEYEQVSAGGGYGGEHTCSLTTDNDILCVGFDTWGQCSPPVDDDEPKDSGTN